ncbi:hypothetical protein CSB93_1485 [Pseudomonas paraeruginosa]|nr:hypothetical protein CSB93_1485 [Pseudomonas paraeruginosa]AWE94345.1 hypothetical protein CSC28_0256 [Pseudomonas paraeruginosa]
MSLGLRRFPEGSGERFRQSGMACTGGSDGERLVEKSSIR